MIIAVDFDGTLFDHDFPRIGAPRHWLIRKVIEWKQAGHKIILWTCREDVPAGHPTFAEGQYLTDAVNACRQVGLEFDAVNRNLEEQIPGIYSRKIFADLYLDDKSVAFLDDSHTFTFNRRLCVGGNFL